MGDKHEGETGKLVSSCLHGRPRPLPELYSVYPHAYINGRARFSRLSRPATDRHPVQEARVEDAIFAFPEV